MLTLDDVQSLSVSSLCRQHNINKELYICQHENTIILKDGRQSFLHDGMDTCSIITDLANEKILMNEGWKSAEEIKEHFAKYKNSNDLESPEKLLNETFKNIKPVTRRCSLL
jgi:hypothetical protein